MWVYCERAAVSIRIRDIVAPPNEILCKRIPKERWMRNQKEKYNYTKQSHRQDALLYSMTNHTVTQTIEERALTTFRYTTICRRTRCICCTCWTTFSMKSPSVNAVYKKLKAINERKAAGLDKIHACKLLKIAAEIVAPSLTYSNIWSEYYQHKYLSHSMIGS